MRLYNVVLGALAQAVPDRVPAAGAGQAAMVVLSAPDAATGKRGVTVLEPMFGGGGATRRGPGPSAIDSGGGFLKNTPVESMEAHIPVLAERYELLPDPRVPGSTAAGGAFARFPHPPAGVHRDRAWHRAHALRAVGPRRGARRDAHTNLRQRRRRQEREIGRIDVLHLEPGDVVSVRTTGGGGYGSPLDRDPAAVAADVRSGLLTPLAAKRDYGSCCEKPKSISTTPQNGAPG